MDEPAENEYAAMKLRLRYLSEPMLFPDTVRAREVNVIGNFRYKSIIIVRPWSASLQIMKNSQFLTQSIGYVNVQPTDRALIRHMPSHS